MQALNSAFDQKEKQSFKTIFSVQKLLFKYPPSVFRMKNKKPPIAIVKIIQ